MLVKSGELNERMSRCTVLAHAGVREYQLTTELMECMQDSSKYVVVEGTAELKADEYAAVKGSMDQGLGKSANKQRNWKPIVETDPNIKELRDTNTKRSTALKQLKKTADVIDRRSQFMLLELPTIAKKG